MRQPAFRGVRVLPWLWRAPPNDRRGYPHYAECDELGVPFGLQGGHAGPLGPSEPGRPIPALDEVALDLPELVFVGGHIGHPRTDEMITLARKDPDVYIDTSAYRPGRYPRELVACLRAGGRRKVLFGRNLPVRQLAACIGKVPALGLDAEATRLFLHDNAAAVLGLRGGARA